MYGTLGGNVLGILYFFAYQIVGICFSSICLRKEKKELQLLLGSIIGTVGLHWFPTIVSLVMDFNTTSHVIGLVLFVLLVVTFGIWGQKKKFWGREEQKKVFFLDGCKELCASVKGAPVFFVCMCVLFVFFAMMLVSHSFPLGDNGEIRTGQCTYGDMNMHLGFITSIANQQTFPPDYSILPGVKLAYPFLCDSVSSSVYVFGASLWVAYMLPMLLAILQAMLGFYCLGTVVLKDKAKALTAWILFFFNGGFGFIYFFDKLEVNKENFTRIFTGFYTTPTNLVDDNVRWSNVIVDMLLPQRATLFGWAVLFGTLALIYRAMEEKKIFYFVLAAVFGGALPMIHTHSFLALAIVCAVWVVGYMHQLTGGDMEGENKIAGYLVPVGLVVMSVLQIWDWFQSNIKTTGMALLVGILFVVVSVVVYYIYKICKQGKFKELFHTWGIFLVIVLILALPQLFTWTFQQVGGETSYRGHFNWANEMDQYVWFYIKNLGLPALVGVPALIYAKKKKFFMAAPVLLVWSIAEVVVFQPNVYDNNKLLYVGYGLLILLVADFMCDLWKSLYQRRKMGSIALAIGVLFISTVSGALTMGREYVSGEEYELYGVNQVKLCEYIEENTEPAAVILTNGRHNNAVSSLTGRNIVCGSGSFLYYHGLDYQGREGEVATMYQAPGASAELFQKYQVSYILVGPEERGNYAVDEAGIQMIADCVFSENDVQLYKIR